MNEHAQYIQAMHHAIRLAEKGRFHTCPNPVVGAVLLDNGQIVAEGYHHKAGEPHAEIVCLEDAAKKGISPAAKTMVVTLEPCAHYGKTPPCCNTLHEAGIARLVFGCYDPNPEASGGARYLANHGIDVVGPVLEQECRDLIADFRIWQTTSRPYVYLKLASTLDGRIATRTGHSQWISSAHSRSAVHKLRANVGMAGGAILIGGGTFRADNPLLTARADSVIRQPLACILTSRLPNAPEEFQLLAQRPEQTIFFVSPATAASKSAELLRETGCQIIAIGPNSEGRPDFDAMLSILRNDFGCYYVLCEGGGHLAMSLLTDNKMDEMHLYLAPILLGDENAKPLFSGQQPLSIDDARRLRFTSLDLGATDARLILRPIDSGTR